MKGKRLLPLLLTRTAALCAGLLLAALLLRPRPLIPGELSLDQTADGDYLGVCQNKILTAVVLVHVRDHRITGIDVLEHKKSYRSQAEQTAREICARQSLDVDSISGATFTCDTVRKAVENALSGEPLP